MEHVLAALRQHFGETAARDLEKFGETLGSRWSQQMLQTATERFDNRLAIEMSSLRLEMQKGFADLRVELLRWSFLFWIGQVAVVTSLIAFMLRGLIPK